MPPPTPAFDDELLDDDDELDALDDELPDDEELDELNKGVGNVSRSFIKAEMSASSCGDKAMRTFCCRWENSSIL